MNTATATNLIGRHPSAFSACSSSASPRWTCCSRSWSTTSRLSRLSVIGVGVVSGAVLSALGALAVTQLGLWRQLGFTGRPKRRLTLLWSLPFAVYGLLPLTQSLDVTPTKAAGAIAFGVLVAIWKLTVLGLLLYA